MIASAIRQFERELGEKIERAVPSKTLSFWRHAPGLIRESGVSFQIWLSAPPAKHSTRQLSEMLEKIDFLYSLDVHRYLDDLPDDLVRRYGRQMSRRPPWNRRKSRSRAERSSSPAL